MSRKSDRGNTFAPMRVRRFITDLYLIKIFLWLFSLTGGISNEKDKNSADRRRTRPCSGGNYNIKLQSDIYDFIGYAVVGGDEPVYDNNQWAYENVKRMTVDEILNYPGLDAICIETEDRRLTEYAIKAAEKGLHIQMDKPGSESDKDFDRLI